MTPAKWASKVLICCLVALVDRYFSAPDAIPVVFIFRRRDFATPTGEETLLYPNEPKRNTYAVFLQLQVFLAVRIIRVFKSETFGPA